MENPSFRRKTNRAARPSTPEPVAGFEVKSSLSIGEILPKYERIGFQGSQLGRAAKLIERMKAEKVSIFLAYTSNMVSSGLREIIAQLVRERKVAGIVTSTGAIEEDIMKASSPFRLGDFDVDDGALKKVGFNRIGNVLVADEQYCDFEDFHMRVLEKLWVKKKIWAPSEYIEELGKTVKDKSSILHWASENKIPIFAPGFVDGAMGDHFFFFNQNRKEPLVIDTAADVTKFYKLVLEPKKIGGIILGGGIAKHHLIGAAILRDGLDYAIYVQTGTPYDGSLSGARPTEAISWNKLKELRNSVSIEADATLVFPLLAAKWLGK